MTSKRYSDEFKVEAVRQVTDRGLNKVKVAGQLGITTHSLYAWLRKFGKPGIVQRAEPDQSAEARRLKGGALQGYEGARLSKKGPGVLCQGVEAKYAFIQAHREAFRLCAMCRVYGVHA
jgi:transposase-like protein